MRHTTFPYLASTTPQVAPSTTHSEPSCSHTPPPLFPSPTYGTHASSSSAYQAAKRDVVQQRGSNAGFGYTVPAFSCQRPGDGARPKGSKDGNTLSVRPSVSSASSFSWKTEGDVYEVQYIYNTKVKSAHHLLRFLSLNGNWK